MIKGANSKIFNTIFVALAAILISVGTYLFFSSKGIPIQGSDDLHGVYFTYKGTKYQVFMLPWEEGSMDSLNKTILIPDDEKYEIKEDKNFLEENNLWNGKCDCYKKLDKMSGKLTVTMNLTGKPQEYTFYMYGYENRNKTEVVYLSDGKGAHGYGFSTKQ